MAIKLAKEDEQTLAQLAAEAEESKARELAATKRADEAVTLIRALTIEVNSLKRQLKTYEVDKIESKSDKSSMMSLNQQLAMNDVADAEVEAMLNNTNTSQAAFKDVSQVALKSATTFDKWKMEHFLFTPDTPGASLNHDKHVVDVLMESATQELIDDIRMKRTCSSLGKVKKLQKRIVNEQDRSKMMAMTARPANDYEGVVLPDAVTGNESHIHSQIPPQQLPPINASEKELVDFFLSTGVEQKWGNRPTFDHNNMGRMNLWAANDQLHPRKQRNLGSPLKSPARLPSQTTTSQSQVRSIGNK